MNERIWIMYESDIENVLSDHENNLRYCILIFRFITPQGDNQAILSIEIWNLITHNYSLIIPEGKSLD